MKGINYENFNSEIIKEPFRHTHYKLFDNNLCLEIIENFKKISDYLVQSKGLSESRFKINLYGNTITGWDKKHDSFLNDIKNLQPLNDILEEYKNKISRLLYNKYNDEKKDDLNFCLMLVYDKKNYEIGPHTDSHRRNCTLITYLNSTEENIGVNLYKDKINRHKTKWLKKHYKFDNFEKCKQIINSPGSSVDFKVHSNSFHGVPEIKKECDRYSIQFYVMR